MNTDKLTIEEIKQCYQYHSMGRKPGKTLLLRTCNELIGYKNIEKDALDETYIKATLLVLRKRNY